MKRKTNRLTEADYSLLRERMVKEQLKQRGVSDQAVLVAMSKVKRHRFVRVKDQLRAYGDHPLPIDSDQTISQPYVVASMTAALEINKRSRVLEIGTGCGYQCAVLAEIAAEVFSIECIHVLYEEARELLSKLGYRRIQLLSGDGTMGWPEAAPFDAIIVTAAAPTIPNLLIDQLAEGGRMIIPVGSVHGEQNLIKLVKVGDKVERHTMFPVRFVPMTGAIDNL